MRSTIHNQPDLATLFTAARALSSPHVRLAGMRLYVPGPVAIRLSVVLSNLRMQKLLDQMLRAGDRVVDVGANIGYNTLYAARCVGPTGHVTAIEPAQDNLAILYANLFANRIDNVDVLPYAATHKRALLKFYLRGDISAVNSLFADNFYHHITNTVEVLGVPLDDLLADPPHVVKIDVEGGELGVLKGMTRILQAPSLRLIVEWHPTLQQEVGHPPDALPHYLLRQGFNLDIITHWSSSRLRSSDIARHTAHLLRRRSPVELVAYRT